MLCGPVITRRDVLETEACGTRTAAHMWHHSIQFIQIIYSISNYSLRSCYSLFTVSNYLVITRARIYKQGVRLQVSIVRVERSFRVAHNQECVI